MYAAGKAQMEKMVTIAAPPSLTNTFIVATATDEDGNTSEFSAADRNHFADDSRLGADRHSPQRGQLLRTRPISISTSPIRRASWSCGSISFINLATWRWKSATNSAICCAESDTSSIDQNFEEVIIPVVTQEKYFISVIAVDVPMGDEAVPQLYSLEMENFPAPVPSGVHLDPASDTGMMNNDNVTSDTTPTFFIQTDVLNFVDTNNNGTYQDPGHVWAATQDAIDALTAAKRRHC